jgi:signal transduction histidine kinase
LLIGEMPAVRSAAEELPVTVTNIGQLQHQCDTAPGVACALALEGNVWWANATKGMLVLQDPSGAEALELEFGQDFPAAGERVRIEGKALLTRRNSAIRIGSRGAVVDNNGVHAMVERSGKVYLEAGRHPLRVEWFNGVKGAGLEVECEAPNLPRQKIPENALLRHEGGTNAGAKFVQGLEVEYFEAPDEVLPDFAKAQPITRGVTRDFALNQLPHAEHIAAVFSGFLDATAEGLYTFFIKSDDGSRLFAGSPCCRATKLGICEFPEPKRLTVGQILTPSETPLWAEVEGKVTLLREGREGLAVELSAGAGHMLVELAEDSGLRADGLLNARVRAQGFCQGVRTLDRQSIAGKLLVPDAAHIKLLEPGFNPVTEAPAASNSSGLQTLRTAAEVHRLKRDEASRAYPVKIEGVVTCVLPEHQAFTIQDTTRGIYVVDFTSSLPDRPYIGEYLEVEGASDSQFFAPIINARRVTSRGAGKLPEPARPTWDQLNNGSQDAQEVELEGIVTGVGTNELTLLTRGGVINVELRLAAGACGNLLQNENARVRIRGCLLASWDYVTHQVRMGDVKVYSADILVDEPSPADLFSSPRKTARELLLFDPQAGVFQRVRVSGQIVHIQEGQYFLMDGDRGVRFFLKDALPLETGDLVDVVGFLDLLGSASPVLREAAARKTGHANLPLPRTLQRENLVSADHDATRVKLIGTLANIRTTRAATFLEIQNEARTFVARLTGAGQLSGSLDPGSRLQLTGVYDGLGGNRASGRDITSFELLLDSPSDIQVLARPPWWTLRRLMIILGALAFVLAVAALWINQLHRQVEERTAELSAQIQQRQRVEQQRAMEQERTRIAQDLHDELGSGITEMSMLAARAKASSAPDEKRALYLDQVGGKARDLVTGLDEIVWAMNPRHDSLSSVVSYFSLYADRFLGLANIGWKLEGSPALPDRAIDSRSRHQLFLAFKEALTNVVRHSGATQVRISIRGEGARLQMQITDNGRGFANGAPTENMDGVVNMRRRIEELGGRFEINSRPGAGTTVSLEVPAEFQA